MAAGKLVRENITVEVSDGTRMDCYVARPGDGAVHPGLLVHQELFGVNHHIRDVCDRFAAEGYVAIAAEFFHRIQRGLLFGYDKIQEAMPLLRTITPAHIKLDLEAAYAWLAAQSFVDRDRISSVGYCLGGRISFAANTVLPLRSAVSYYGGRPAPEFLDNAKSLHAPMLFFWGGRDKHLTRELRDEVVGAVHAAGKPYTNVVISDADHGFFCDARPDVYNARAARESWALTLEFLRS